MMAGSENMRRLSLNDVRSLAYERWGRVGGRRLLWLGGNPGPRLSRHPDADFYARHDLDVATFDRPGYGQSSRWTGRRVADTAADVESLLDTLDWDGCDIIGLSGGGAHALSCGALLSERVSAIAVGGCPSPPSETSGWGTISALDRMDEVIARLSQVAT